MHSVVLDKITAQDLMGALGSVIQIISVCLVERKTQSEICLLRTIEGGQLTAPDPQKFTGEEQWVWILLPFKVMMLRDNWWTQPRALIISRPDLCGSLLQTVDLSTKLNLTADSEAPGREEVYIYTL